MGKQILFKGDALEKLARGAQQFNDAVTITMGAKGQNVLIEDGFGSSLPHVTKDGVTVAKSIVLKDVVENIAATMIKNVALETNDQVGDGTTTATSLANAVIQYGRAAIMSGVHPIMLKRGLDIQLHEVVKALDAYSVSIDDIEQTYKVAYISANGDDKIARLVTNVYKEVGKDGNVAIEVSRDSIESYYEKVEGISFKNGYNNPYYMNNPKGTADFTDAYVLICDYVIHDMNEIQEVLKLVAAKAQNKPLLIICEDIDIRAEEKLILNKMNGALQVAVVKAPEFGDRRLDYLEDIAIVTGGIFASNLTGIRLQDIREEHLGKAARVIVGSDDTSIIGGFGSEEYIADRIDHVKQRLENAADEEIKAYQEKRYARLKGGVVVIKVGGYSDVEKIELKDRVEDAVNSVKSSLIDGIIPGGGAPLLRIGDKGFKETDISKSSGDVNKGRLVLLEAIKEPFRQIVSNAGLDAQEIEKEILKKSKNIVYDVMTESYKDGFKYGVIDPVLVTKTALINAVSIAGTLLTTGCTINYEADNSKPVDINLP
jgi:chaperonin GroEL